VYLLTKGEFDLPALQPLMLLVLRGEPANGIEYFEPLLERLRRSLQNI